MTFTVWSNAGKFEWVAYMGDNIVDRSGFVFRSYNTAFRALLKKYGAHGQ